MRVDILTLFPEMFTQVFGSSMIARAVKNNIIKFRFVNIRDYAGNKHGRVDDYPYGGGPGMLMMAKPIYDAYKSLSCDDFCRCNAENQKPLVIYLSPKGSLFNQQLAFDLSKRSHLIFICGHYEGVDQRVIDEIADMELSVGDFILTGGEIPCMTVVDAVTRLLPGVLSSDASFKDESFSNGLLEHPQYTRPSEFMGRTVPDVLLSGNHKEIELWKKQQSLRLTFLRGKNHKNSGYIGEK